MESYHENGYNASGNRQLKPFEYVATPPITHLIMAILSYCRKGGSFAPGVRQLSEMSGVTLGLISGLLYELDRSGWISYDGHVIMVLRDLDESDQATGDQLIADHLIGEIDESQVEEPFGASERDDQNPDRSNAYMVDSCLAAAESESAAARSKIPCAAENDQHRDHPASLQLAELGTNPTLRRRAIAARPDLTPQQVRDTWAHFEQRIAAGRCTAAAFHAAIADGQIHAAPPDPAMPLDPQAYAGRDGFALGGAPPPEADAPESIADHAWRILPANAPMADCILVQTLLARGKSEADALGALADRRARR